jgi:hypothetical protein
VRRLDGPDLIGLRGHLSGALVERTHPAGEDFSPGAMSFTGVLRLTL